MFEALRPVLATLIALLVFVPDRGAAQRPPDLSGDWVLVSATSSGGRLRGGAEVPTARGEQRISANTVSGAPFNCGRQCTIIHKGRTLTVDRAYLASNATPAPTVMLQLDGRQRSVVDSFSPSREIPATAQWAGDRLKITSSTPTSLRGELTFVVVTSVNIDGDAPVTFKYKKK